MTGYFRTLTRILSQWVPVFSDLSLFHGLSQVTLKSEESGKAPQVVRAKFVVGADGACKLRILLFTTSSDDDSGAHSVVRRLVGIQMEGSQTRELNPMHLAFPSLMPINLSSRMGVYRFPPVSQFELPRLA